MFFRILFLSFVLFSVSNCASIISGTSQSISVQSSPPGASCDLSRNGSVIGSIAQTPGSAFVKKTKDDISLVCKKPNFQDATAHLDSGIDGMVYWNILLGGFIGWGIDSAAGADNKYPESNFVSLIPRSSQASSQLNSTDSSTQQSSEAVSGNNVAERLKNLEDLKNQGLISAQDYKVSKERILKEI